MSIIEAECAESQTLTDERDAYIDLLLCAAKDFHDRGWVPIPIYYRNGTPSHPRGALSWRGRTWKSIESRFYQADAIGLSLVDSKLTWLDFDRYDQFETWLSKASPVLRSLPRYRTNRGVHVIARLRETIVKPIDFRNDSTVNGLQSSERIEGELRCGKCLVIVPPSIHREGITRYRWDTPLYESDDSFPVLGVAELLNNSNATRFALDTIRSQSISAKTEYRPPRKDRSKSPKPQIHNVSKVTEYRGHKSGLFEAIEMTLPTRKGLRTKMLPVYVRLLKNMYRGDVPECEVRGFGQAWWEVAASKGLTNEKTGKPTSDYVWYLWERFDNSKKGRLTDARSLARTVLDDSEIDVVPVGHKYAREMREYFRLVYAFDYLCDGGEFHLGGRPAGEHIGLPHQRAWDIRNELIAAGHIVCTHPGTQGTKSSRLAASLIFVHPIGKHFRNQRKIENEDSTETRHDRSVAVGV